MRYTLQKSRIVSKSFLICSMIGVTIFMGFFFFAPEPVLSKDQPSLKDITKETEEKPEPTETEKPKVVKAAGPADEFGRGIPRGTVKG